jgi:uncharacterized OB-fold protein
MAEARWNSSANSASYSLLGQDVTPLPIFWAEGEGLPTLAGSRCPSCGDLRFPPQSLCPMDGEAADRVPLCGRGRIYEVVKVAIGPAGLPTPYWAGYVDLDEGVRAFGRIETERSRSRDPAHGDLVVLEFTEFGDRTGTGDRVLAPLFRQQL